MKIEYIYYNSYFYANKNIPFNNYITNQNMDVNRVSDITKKLDNKNKPSVPAIEKMNHLNKKK